jgi:hypothetical protein
MKNSKKIILLISSIAISFLILEFFLRILSVELPESDYDGVLYSNYSKDEMNLNLPYRHKNHGGNCVKERFNKKMRWHPRFGYNDKDVDLKCISKLFDQNKINIIFMGGSAMANYETPNYLTSIEYYMFQNDDQFRSVNLAESGARLSNELSIFLEYVPKMLNKPDFIFFFDGYNEFNSIRYNGNPEDDYYWTGGVKKRVHEPSKFYFDVALERSHFLKFLLNNILGFSSSRIQGKEIKKSKILNSAEDYIYRKEILTELCEVYEIECIFILQPAFVLSKNLNNKTDLQIKKWHEKYFKNDQMILETGYKKIILSDKKIYDLKNIFDDKSNIYFDYVHSNKYGSEIIGNNLRKILNNKLNF